jgi:multiple sugar transport system substrate-binding protein
MTRSRVKKTFVAPLVLATIVLGAGLSSCGTKIDPYKLDWSADTKGTTISFWTPFGSDIETTLEGIVSKFEDETGITVNMEAKGGYDNLEKAVALSASTNSMPNLTLAYPDHEAAYVDINAIVRLDYYFENDGDDTFNISDFYSDYMAENQSIEFKTDGTPYTLGVPFNKSTEVLVYNESFFDWAKTRDATIVVPTSWNDLDSVGKKINTLLAPYFGKFIGSDNIGYAKKEDIPSGVKTLFDFSTVTADSFRPLSYDSQSNFFITACRQWGGKYTEVSDGKGYLAFDSSEVRTALSDIKTLYKDDVLGIPANWDQDKYSSTPFKFLQTVMAIGSSAGVANDVPTGNKFTINSTTIPYKDADKKYVISQGTNLVLLDQGTNVQRIAAWKLLKFLAKEANGEFCAATGYFPSCEASATSSAYEEFLNQTVVSTTDKIRRNTALVNRDSYMKSSEAWHKFVDPGFNGSSTIREAVNTSIAQLLIDDKTPDSIIKDLYSNLSEYVRS